VAVKHTPLVAQYLSVKQKVPDAILFFRLGDFYEMFFEDAEVGARVLDIQLTSRNAAVRFGLETKGAVAIGMDADLVVLDEGERVVHASELHSAIDYSPYEGMKLRMWPAATICGGTLVYLDGAFPGDGFRGEILNHRFRGPARDDAV